MRGTSSTDLACATQMVASSFHVKHGKRHVKEPASRSLRRMDTFERVIRRRPKPAAGSQLAALSVTSVGARWFQIDPRVSKAMPYWDTITAIAIVFTAFVTPYEVSFLPMAASALEPLFLINRMLDVVFIADMSVQFVLIYSVGNQAEGVRWVEDPRRIVLSYLKGWFTIDATSIAVSSVDLIGLQTGGSSNVASLRSLRALRALRLLKLARLLRASRIFARCESFLQCLPMPAPNPISAVRLRSPPAPSCQRQGKGGRGLDLIGALDRE